MARDALGKFVSDNQQTKNNSTKAVKPLGRSFAVPKIGSPLKLGFNLTTLVILIEGGICF